MLPKTLALLLAPVLAGAGLGGAVLTGNAPFLASAPASPEPPAGWEVLEQFSAEVDPSIVAGTLDLRTFAGPIHVVGWDEARYEVTVLKRAGQQGAGPSDASVKAEFAEKADEALGLSLVVRPQGTYDLDLEGDWPPVAVQVFVPAAITWDAVLVCSAMTGSWGGLRDTLGGLVGRGEREAACVEGSEPIGGGIQLNVQESESDEAEVIPFALENLRGGELLVLAEYSDIALVGLSFGAAHLMTEYGSIEGQLDAAELVAFTEYGNVHLTTVVDDLKALTEYGNVMIQVLGGGSGAYELNSEYGSIGLHVPPSLGERGYEAHAMTQYGEAVIDLEGVEMEAPDEDHQARGLGLPTLLKADLQGPEKPKRGHGNVAMARTTGFEDMPIQVTIQAVTEYGNVLITDKVPEVEEEEN